MEIEDKASEKPVRKDRAFIARYLRESQDAFEQAIHSFPPSQWLQSPDEGRWSAGECAAHVVIVEGRIQRLLGRLAHEPREEVSVEKLARRDEIVIRAAFRNERREAPAFIQPTAEQPTAEVILLNFREHRGALLRILEEDPEFLQARFLEHPFLKKLDGYQWLLLASSHVMRHVAQLDEIRQQIAKETT